MFKIQIIQDWQRGGSALVAEICAGPHNRLLRRQHCSSLCSQSEGHEHAANMASALAHDFVGFLAVFGRHNIRPPHFASKVSYSASPQASAKCPRITPYSSVNVSFMIYRFKIEGLLKNRVEIPSLIFFATFWPCRFCVSKILISFVRILVCFFILTTQEVFHLSQE